MVKTNFVFLQDDDQKQANKEMSSSKKDNVD